MKVVVMIPARMGSSRFPGKALAPIFGLPMIEHVRRRIALSNRVSDVYVLSPDKEIIDYVVSQGGKAMFDVGKSPGRCMAAVADAAESLQADIIVNIQGDEPLVRPEVIDLLVDPFDDPEVLCTNIMSSINEEDLASVNVVKTVADLNNDALYFSREAIPTRAWKETSAPWRKQTGLIAFRSSFLSKYASWGMTPLETAEHVDMLRVLENGYKVRMVLYDDAILVGVDTPSDLSKAEALLKKDDLFPKYSKK